jgi:drug/metabolite transporter (DMT)-like permease
MHYFTSIIVFKTLKITPNLSYSHTIINTNILITLLLSYCFFKESFNIYTLTGIFLILIGVILIINYH